MPKRTQEQLDARRDQIMRAALACMVRKGFHQTSMRDICREAKLSAGAVYNYFSGKEEIIAAATEASRSANRAALAEISASSSAQQALIALLGFLFDLLQSDSFHEYGSIDADVLAEAQRSTKVREIVEKEYHSLTIPIAAIIRKGQEQGKISKDVDPVSIAKTIVALFVGIKLHILIHGSDDLNAFRKGIQQILFGSIWQTGPAQEGD
jgi:AcrR family transcriptional regulator